MINHANAYNIGETTAKSSSCQIFDQYVYFQNNAGWIKSELILSENVNAKMSAIKKAKQEKLDRSWKES